MASGETNWRCVNRQCKASLTYYWREYFVFTWFHLFLHTIDELGYRISLTRRELGGDELNYCINAPKITSGRVGRFWDETDYAPSHFLFFMC